jgi:uncharacterized membrane protein YccC
MPVYPKNTAPLTSLPMRITQLQRTRLEQAREHDHIAIQEHVRRALDQYLDGLERRRAKALAEPMELVDEAPSPLPQFVRDPPAIQQAAGRRKVVYR